MRDQCKASRNNFIRVVIADASRYARTLIAEAIVTEPDVVAIGSASSGQDAVRLVETLNPDLVLMGNHLTDLDGVQATHRIMSTCPTPILIVTDEPSEATFLAMTAGAVDTIASPACRQLSSREVRSRFIRRLKDAAKLGKRGVLNSRVRPRPREGMSNGCSMMLRASAERVAVVAMGASTGGPPCVLEILSKLSREHSPPIVLTQHMAPQFLPSFVTWLGAGIELQVQIAEHGSRLSPGNLYVAPGNATLRISEAKLVNTSTACSVRFTEPSIDQMFESVARVFGEHAIGVVLTGVGSDGALGMKSMRESGALTVVQDQASCLAHAMPRAACELNAASLSANPKQIAQLLRDIRHGTARELPTTRPGNRRALFEPERGGP